MKKLMVILLAASMVCSLAACGSTANTAASSAAGTTATAEGSSTNAAPDVKIGAIVLGDETEGYSAAHINGIKEASGNISQVAKIAQLCGDELNIYSGNDDQVVPLLSLGGKGVISVVSNVKPELVHNCCKAWFEGDTKSACKLQLEILPLADALFCEVNPIPVKYAMNVLGWEAGPCRLPLVEPSDAHKEKIEQALEAEGLIRE